MLFWTVIALAFVGWTAFLALLYRMTGVVRRVADGVEEGAEQARSQDVGPVLGRIAALELKVDKLPSVWEDWDDKVRKKLERTRYYARQLADRDEESDELGGGDVSNGNGSGGGFQQLPTMPAGMAPAQPQQEYDLHALAWRRKLGG